MSPKYAPEIIAPATRPIFIDNRLPIPINATPTVAAVVQELPVASETTAQIIHEVSRKNCGLINSIP